LPRVGAAIPLRPWGGVGLLGENFRFLLGYGYIFYGVVMVASTIPYESEIARRWWAISPGNVLPLSNGGSVQIVFAGYPGG